MQYTSYRHCLRRMLKDEGWTSLYRGIGVNRRGPRLLLHSHGGSVEHNVAACVLGCLLAAGMLASACCLAVLLNIWVVHCRHADSGRGCSLKIVPGAAIQFLAYDVIKTSLLYWDPSLVGQGL